MEDDIRTAITEMRSPALTRGTSKGSNNEARSAKSAFIWMIRRFVVSCLLLVELSRIAAEYATDYLIDEGFFGKDISEEVSENRGHASGDVDLDDTFPVLAVQLLLHISIPAIFLPHIIAYFLPKLVGGHDRDL